MEIHFYKKIIELERVLARIYSDKKLRNSINTFLIWPFQILRQLIKLITRNYKAC
jgi:hypothetical protein